MPLVGGADEIVIIDIHQLPELLDAANDLVHVSLRRNPFRLALRSIFWPCSSVPVKKKVS